MPLTIPTVWPLSPAVRSTDPLPSHRAADTASRSRQRVADAVLWLLDRYGPLTGEQLNAKYRYRWRGMGWPQAAYESPRKRAAELVGTYLEVVNPDDIKKRGTPTIYGIRED